MECQTLKILELVPTIVRRHPNLDQRPRSPRSCRGRARRRRHERIAGQQRQLATDAENRHHAQVGSDRSGRVAGLDRPKRVARDADARGHFYRAQPLRLAKVLESIPELQQQLSVEGSEDFRIDHLVNMLTKSLDFGYHIYQKSIRPAKPARTFDHGRAEYRGRRARLALTPARASLGPRAPASGVRAPAQAHTTGLLCEYHLSRSRSTTFSIFARLIFIVGVSMPFSIENGSRATTIIFSCS